MSATALAIACGLGTALCFGTGDYLAARLTRHHGYFAAMFAVQLAAALVLGVIAWAWHGLASVTLDGRAWATVAGIGLVNTLGLVGLYRAFELGKLSLVSPIAGSMGAFAVAFAWLAGSPPAAVMVPGLVAVVLGIVGASVVIEPRAAEAPPSRAPLGGLRPALGVGWALLSAVGFGWVFFMLGPTSELVGPAWAVFGLRVSALAVLLVLARVQRLDLLEPLRELRRQRSGRLAAVAALDSGGMLLFAFGSSRGLVAGEIAVVAVLASCFPLVTIVLARTRLREGLSWWQWAGIAVVLLGIAWISGWSESG